MENTSRVVTYLMTSAALLTALRNLLGAEVIHQGVRCRLLEGLDDGPSLVLEDCEENTAIQENQYGGLWRRVPKIYTVPVVTTETREFHPLFVALKLPLSLH